MKDILFVSLALDEPAPLTAFLKKIPFYYYAVVPEMEAFISKEHKISVYPTY